MGGSSKPRSSLHYFVRAERLAPRYEFEGEKLNERSRLALSALATEFRAERVTGFVSGDLAGALGDGNGWNAYPTAMALVNRGWARTGGSRGASYQTSFVYTDEGMRVLFELDRQHREREACRTCGGESIMRHADRHFLERHLDELCTDCVGTLLVQRVPDELRRR